MNDINWLHAIHYYCDRLLELWPGKVALGTALAAILTALGIDHVLFGVLLASVMGEMLTRIIVHCKRGKSLCRGLHHGLVRYSCYFFFLLMAVGVDISLRRALGFALPVTDVFMAYLVLTDCASIIGHLVWLGVPVPPLLVVLVTGGRTRLEKTVEDAVEGRRPRPPYRDGFVPEKRLLELRTLDGGLLELLVNFRLVCKGECVVEHFLLCKLLLKRSHVKSLLALLAGAYVYA